MEEKKYNKKWGGKGKTTVNREPRTVNQGRPEQGRYKTMGGYLTPLMKEEAIMVHG